MVPVRFCFLMGLLPQPSSGDISLNRDVARPLPRFCHVVGELHAGAGGSGRGRMPFLCGGPFPALARPCRSEDRKRVARSTSKIPAAFDTLSSMASMISVFIKSPAWGRFHRHESPNSPYRGAPGHVVSLVLLSGGGSRPPSASRRHRQGLAHARRPVLQTMGMEGGQKVFVFLVHLAPSPNP